MITRRDVIKLVAGASVAAHAPKASAHHRRFTMPAEWERRAGCFMALCAARDLYPPEELQAIREAQGRIAKAIARFEPVTMLANPGDVANARRLCGDGVEVVEVEHFDIWTRDSLPSFVLRSLSRGVDYSVAGANLLTEERVIAPRSILWINASPTPRPDAPIGL